MGTRVLCICFLALGVSALNAAPNPKFEGIWAGFEATQVDASIITKGESAKVPAEIAIGDSGRLLGVVKGISPGRYIVSMSKSGGNVLFYSARPDGPFWVKLVLSPDGNTLTETGQVMVTLESGARESALSGRGPFKALGAVPVSGVFHRQR